MYLLVDCKTNLRFNILKPLLRNALVQFEVHAVHTRWHYVHGNLKQYGGAHEVRTGLKDELVKGILHDIH